MNIADMMKQAKDLQERMASIQAELSTKSVTGSSGGGMVTASVNGKGELLALNIEPQLISPEDQEMLQDLIVAAVNDGTRKASELGKSEMTKLTGGLSLPGFI
jgi:DNA-binding YbaB/EbfC family protein